MVSQIEIVCLFAWRRACTRRFKKALSRWWLFGASWIIAFALLPVLPISLALLCWVVWIGYQIKKTTMNLDNQVALVASNGTNR